MTVLSYAAGSGVLAPGYAPGDTEDLELLQAPLKCRHYHQVLAGRAAMIAHAQSTTFLPSQLASIYSVPLGDGSGQTIGIISLGGSVNQSDLALFEKVNGLGAIDFQIIPVNGNQAVSDPQGADVENALDVQVSAALAPKAKIRLFSAANTGSDFAAAGMQAVQYGCTVISISWGAPEDAWSDADIQAFQSFLQLAAQHNVTVCVASGDNGSSDGEVGNHVDFPSSHPLAVACGGTSLTVANGVRATEVVWNNGAQSGATGGGCSSVFAIPSYQNPSYVPGNGRAVPDVASVADPNTGLRIYVAGQETIVGGTSGAAPFWAGYFARLNQLLGKPVGDPHAVLYKGLGSQGFFDVTSGNNGTYIARAGYDCCTGVGAPGVGTALLAIFQGDIATPPAPPSPPPVASPPPPGGTGSPTPPAPPPHRHRRRRRFPIFPFPFPFGQGFPGGLGGLGGILGTLGGQLPNLPGLPPIHLPLPIPSLPNLPQPQAGDPPMLESWFQGIIDSAIDNLASKVQSNELLYNGIEAIKPFIDSEIKLIFSQYSGLAVSGATQVVDLIFAKIEAMLAANPGTAILAGILKAINPLIDQEIQALLGGVLGLPAGGGAKRLTFALPTQHMFVPAQKAS